MPISADTNLSELQCRLQQKIDELYAPTKPNGYSWVREATLESVVWTDDESNSWKAPYTVADDDQIVFGERTKVEQMFLPVAESVRLTSAESVNTTLELTSGSDKGWAWKVRVIREGLTESKNTDLTPYGFPGKFGKKYYSAESLLDAATRKAFDDAPFTIRPEANHLARQNNTNITLRPNDELRQIGGTFRNVVADEEDNKVVLEGKLALRRNPLGEYARGEFLKAYDAGESVVLDLSWTGIIDAEVRRGYSDEPILYVTRIEQVDSVDPCLKGNAGGKIYSQILEAAESAVKHKKKMPANTNKITQIARLRLAAAEADVPGADGTGEGGGLPATLVDFAAQFIWDNLPGAQDAWESKDDIAALEEDKLIALFDKAITTKSGGGEAMPVTGAPAGESKKIDAAEAQIKDLKDTVTQLQVMNTQTYVQSALKDSKLPDKAREVIANRFKATVAESAVVDTAIREMRELLGQTVQTSDGLANVGEDQKDRMERGVMEFFFQNASEGARKEAEKILGYNPSDDKNRMWTSLREMYINLNGLRKLGRGFGLNERGNASESYSAGISTNLVKDAMHIRVTADYRSLIQFDDFKKISTSVPLNDFRPLNTQNFGEFTTSPSLPVSGDDFPELNLTGAEEVTLTLQNRGGLFSILWEDIVNDTVGEVQKMPKKLARGFKRQLYKYIFDMVWTAKTTAWAPDSGFIASSGHTNLLTSSANLSAANVLLGRNALMKIAELGSTEPMGIAPKYLIHRTDDYNTAHVITTPAQGQYNTVATTDQSLGLERIEVPHWAAGERWALMADTNDIECITVGYYENRQEPEITQETQGTGASFTAMKMRFRAHFPWQAGWSNWRGVYLGFVS